MGAKSCDARSILTFLRKTESRYLYLVGDIIDGWKMKKRWYWTSEYSQILDELARKVAEGTQLIYVPGNHDEKVRLISAFRRIRFARRMRIEIKSRVTHITATGEKFLIIHGDQFDRQILKGHISKIFDRLYETYSALIERRTGPNITIDGKVKRFSLAKALKKGGKIALYLLNNFETALYKEAQKFGVNGIICGHTHIAAIKSIRDITYANCGAWLRNSHSAIVETLDGKLQLVDWPSPPDIRGQYNLFNPEEFSIRIIPSAYRYRPVTDRIIKSLINIWHPDHRTSPQFQDWLKNFAPPKQVLNPYLSGIGHFITHKITISDTFHTSTARRKTQQYLTFTPIHDKTAHKQGA